jgi:hypothetical protein
MTSTWSNHRALGKAGILGGIVLLTILGLCLSNRPRVEVHGDFSKQDVVDLLRLSHAERQRDLIDWSAPPAPLSIRQVTYRWRRFKFESANPIRIDQKPDQKAEVTIGAASSMRRYQFVRTQQGWKHVTPEFE